MMMEKTKPTTEQWREIGQRLSVMYDTVYLDCDGFLVALTLRRVGEMRLAITVYVNGWFKAKWLGLASNQEPSEEGRRFFQERTASVYSGKTKNAIRRAFGKKESERKVSYRSGFWSSFNSLRRHLVTNNDSIVLLDLAEYKARLERHEAAEAVP